MSEPCDTHNCFTFPRPRSTSCNQNPLTPLYDPLLRNIYGAAWECRSFPILSAHKDLAQASITISRAGQADFVGASPDTVLGQTRRKVLVLRVASPTNPWFSEFGHALSFGVQKLPCPVLVSHFDADV